MTVGSGSIVEAAHIHQFADSRNNHPRNGIALCKNAHWMFDEGLWSLDDDDYRVLIDPKRFDESGINELLLTPKATLASFFPPTVITGLTKLISHGTEDITASKPPSYYSTVSRLLVCLNTERSRSALHTREGGLHFICCIHAIQGKKEHLRRPAEVRFHSSDDV